MLSRLRLLGAGLAASALLASGCGALAEQQQNASRDLAAEATAEAQVDTGEAPATTDDAVAAEAQEENPPATTVAGAALLYDSDANGNFEVFLQFDDGVTVQLTNDPAFDSWWARISPDETEFLFYRTPAGTHDRDFSVTSVWMANIDGSNQREVIPPGANGWQQHGHAEWSPDGTQLTMFAGGRINPQIWVTDRNGGNARQITDGPGINVDPSWSNDGSTIVYVGCPVALCFQPMQEIYTVPSSGGERTRITEDDLRDQDPYFSPDDTTIAFLTQSQEPGGGLPFGYWDIRLVGRNGGPISFVTNQDNVTSLPHWDDDGVHLWTHRLVYGSNRAFDLVRINSQTGQVDEVIAGRASEEYPQRVGG